MLSFKITQKNKICRQPTAICLCFDKLYVSTKGKRVFFSQNNSSFKSILFSSQVNSLSSSENLLFCAQKNGAIFGLNKSHKTVFKAIIPNSQCILSFFDFSNDQLFIGSSNKKVTIFGTDSILKNSYFINDSPLAYFDLSKDDVLCGVSQNDETVQFTNLKTKEKSQLKIIDGFPEIVKFLKNDLLIVGTSTGMLNCFSTVNMKRISFLKFKDSISSIHIVSSTKILVGVPNFIFLIDFSNFNKMEILQEIQIDGIPVDFCGKEKVYCAISRESRIGRWKRCKDGKNQIITLEPENN